MTGPACTGGAETGCGAAGVAPTAWCRGGPLAAREGAAPGVVGSAPECPGPSVVPVGPLDPVAAIRAASSASRGSICRT
ncbi:hypothetical protein GCM10009848_53540 [Micromonospora lupini]